MLTISKTNRIFRVYRHCLRFLGDISDHNYDAELTKTNLCRFIRVIVVFYPLGWALQILTIITPIVTLVLVPRSLFGWQGVLHIWEAIAFLAAMCLAFYLIVLIMDRYREVKGVGIYPTRPREPSVFSIACEVIISNKRKICPYIEFQEGSK